MNIKDLQKEAHAIATEKGWHDEPRSVGDLIALCHSELSEALEDYRAGHMYTWHSQGMAGECKTPKPNGFPIELADLIIRVVDMAKHLGIDLEEAIKIKMAYNRGRTYRHGGKQI